jgi:hypothetical protein
MNGNLFFLDQTNENQVDSTPDYMVDEATQSNIAVPSLVLFQTVVQLIMQEKDVIHLMM